MRGPVHPIDRSCRRVDRSETRVLPSLSHVAPAGVSQPLMESLIVNLLSLSPLQRFSRTRGPSLHRHYPTSTVLRPHPPPQKAGSVSRDTPVDQLATPITLRGFPCYVHLPSTHMPSPLPRWNVRMLMSFNYSRHGGLPHKPGGSASTLEFSRPAQRSLLVTACMLAESLKGSFYIRSFNCFVTSTIVPIATGWNDSCRVGISPTE